MDIGPFENGCFTGNGCELCLYVQTTRHLHERRERIFASLLEQKRRWKGASEFNALLRLESEGKKLCNDALTCYNREILEGKGTLDMTGTAHAGGDKVVTCREDFILWLLREFECYEIDHKEAA